MGRQIAVNGEGEKGNIRKESLRKRGTEVL
jgi:hypothetical protein